MSRTVKNCWICGGKANSREHRTKRSDLAGIFPSPTQDNPLYLHTSKKKNTHIGSFDNKRLKTDPVLCEHCNNTLSQDFDVAWQRMSEKLRQLVLKNEIRDVVRCNKQIFLQDTKKEMLNVHLFFVKLFGCLIVERNLPIDTKPLADAIKQQRHCPLVFLKFGQFDPPMHVGLSDVLIGPLGANGQCDHAAWFYSLDQFSVNVFFAMPHVRLTGLRDAWSPKFGTNKLQFVKFDSDL